MVPVWRKKQQNWRFHSQLDLGIVKGPVANRFRNAILAAVSKIITPKNESALKLVNASFGRDAASLVAGSERDELAGTIRSSAHGSSWNTTSHELSLNDGTRGYLADKVCEFLVPRTHFDRKASRNCHEFYHFIDFNLLFLECSTIGAH